MPLGRVCAEPRCWRRRAASTVISCSSCCARRPWRRSGSRHCRAVKRRGVPSPDVRTTIRGPRRATPVDVLGRCHHVVRHLCEVVSRARPQPTLAVQRGARPSGTPGAARTRTPDRSCTDRPTVPQPTHKFGGRQATLSGRVTTHPLAQSHDDTRTHTHTRAPHQRTPEPTLTPNHPVYAACVCPGVRTHRVTVEEEASRVAHASPPKGGAERVPDCEQRGNQADLACLCDNGVARGRCAGL